MFSRVFIPSFNEYGELLSLGAYASRVKYQHLGVLYDVIMLNDEFFIVDQDDEAIWEEEK